MEMRTVFQLIVSGLTIGCVYSLVGLAFALLIRATGILNFAQGEFVMLGAFIGLTILTYLHLPYLVAFLVAIVVTGAFGILMERVILGPMLRKRTPPTNLFISTLGLSTILQTAAIIIWGADPKPYPPIASEEPLILAGLLVRPQNLLILGLGIAVMVGLQLFLHKTMTGISWRAASLDPDTAALYGVSRKKNVALTFALSSALGGAGGVLIAPLFFATFSLGGAVQIKSFCAATMGAFSTVGTMVGGLVLGVVETLAAGLVSSDYKNVILYGILLSILLFFFRPKAPEGRTAAEAPKAASGSGILLPGGKWRSRLKIGLIGIGLVAWIGFPLTANSYLLHTINLALIYAVAVLGLQLIFGYTGMLSLGHAAFFGIGAYTSTLLVTKLGLSFWLAMPLGALTAGIAGRLVAPILRLSGIYLVVGTVALNEIVFLLMINLKALTNGAYGIYSIPGPKIGPLTIDDELSYYFLISTVLGVAYFVLGRLTKSRFGRALVAVRENELCSVVSGVNALSYKMKAFSIGAACGGLAGALYAPFVSYISPEAFKLTVSVSMVTMAVIGGLGNLAGGLVGALAIILAPEYLRFMAGYRMIVYGAVLVLAMMFFPGGIADLVRKPISLLAVRIGALGRRKAELEARQ